MKRIFAEQITRSVSALTALALVTGTFGFAFGAIAPSAFALTSSAPTTNAATTITPTDATLNGMNGDTAATDSSFWVSTSTFSTATPTLPAGVYSTADLGSQGVGSSYSAMLSSASGLPTVTSGTTYYYAAWSEVAGVWSPGTVMTFTTGSATLPGVLAAQDFGTMNVSGVDGYTAGFGVTGTDLTGATSIVTQLYSGTTLLQTDTSINPAAFPGATQFSSPFDVYGTFNYAADGYWTNVRAAEYGQTLVPTSVVATVTLGNGKIVTATNTNLTGTPLTRPAVTTVAASGITSSNATLNGLNGPVDASGSSFWVSTSTFSTASATVPVGVYSTADLGVVSATSSYAALLSSVAGLPSVTPNTTYYFNAWTNVGGTWYPGAVMQFTTGSTVAPTAPVITSLSTTTGSIAGGTPVTITGTGFTGATSVMFGGTAAVITATTSDTAITVLAPATTTTGVVDIRVTTALGTSAMSAADHFTYTLTGIVTGIGVLHVDSITMTKSSATADGTFGNGWIYTFNLTVPTNETNLSMEFANWVGAGTILAGGNMQISSAQANNGGAEIPITAANVYTSPALVLNGDLDPATAGLQVQVSVGVAVPIGTPNGSYTTSYGVQSI